MLERQDRAALDETALREALADADIAPTLLVLTQLTGDTRLLDEAAPYIQGAWSYQEYVPDELKQRIRDRLVAELTAPRFKADAYGDVPSPELLRHMISAAVGERVPDEYLALLSEEMRLDGLDRKGTPWRVDVPAAERAAFRVGIIGAGLGGLCAAMRLKELKIPFVVFEKNGDVGGTWLENDYPGCGVDIPSHYYSYSFFPSVDWSRHFALRDEILAYIRSMASHYELYNDIRFRHEVSEARFDETTDRWLLTVRSGERVETVDCNVVISSVGQLNRPAIPDIPGLDRFNGPAFHTACWNHDVDLRDRSVAMIGTGASGMQVAPSIAPSVKRLTIFQRTPHWVMPNPNYHKPLSRGMQWSVEHIPYFRSWYRSLLFWASSDKLHASLRVDPEWKDADHSINAQNADVREQLIAYIRSKLDDEDLITKTVPDYPPFGKRMLRDNNWYELLKRPNVELVNGGVREITPDAAVAADGTAYPADVLVFATGFQAKKMLWPMNVVGRQGKTIRDIWGDDDPRAYKGISVPGFPNLFITYGPGTNLAHGGSEIFFFESQVRYVMQAIREMIEKSLTRIECRRDVYEKFNEALDRRHEEMVWEHPRVSSYYRNKAGRVTVTSPWSLLEYWTMTREFDPSDFITRRASDLEKLSTVAG